MMLPLVVHDPDPVGVAVVADAEVGPRLQDLVLKVLHRLGKGRVGVVVRESAVHVAVKLDDLAAELPEDRDGHDTAGAVPGVHDDLELPGELHVPENIVPVFGDEVVRPAGPLPSAYFPASMMPRIVLDVEPESVSSPAIILNPLCSGGLCEPVIITPASSFL